MDRTGGEADGDRSGRLADPALRAAAAAFASSLALLGWWVLRRPFVGLADNGDWGRYSCPLGLSGRVRFTEVPATLAREHCLAFDYRSTFTPFLRAFADVDTWASGAVHLSHLALFWSVVVSLGWGWLAFELSRASGRPLRSLVTVLALVLVSSDVIFTSYFGSIYAEAMVIALLPALGAALVRLVRSDRLGVPSVVVAGLLLVAVTDAKPSMALVAPAFVAVVLVARRGRLDLRRALLGAFAALVLATFSFAAIADPEFTEWNTYNLAFTVVLPNSGDPQATLVDMGIDRDDARQLQRFVGVPFGPSVTDVWYDPPLRAFRAAGRPAVLRALLTHPKAWGDMVRRSGTELGHLRLDYLGNHVRSGVAPTRPLLADRPHPADLVLDPLAALWWLLPVAWVGLAAWFGRRLWRTGGAGGGAAASSALGLSGVVLAATQTVFALGDGDYELAKHLVIAGEATALVAVGVVVAGAWHLADRRRPAAAPPEAPEAPEAPGSSAA